MIKIYFLIQILKLNLNLDRLGHLKLPYLLFNKANRVKNNSKGKNQYKNKIYLKIKQFLRHQNPIKANKDSYLS